MEWWIVNNQSKYFREELIAAKGLVSENYFINENYCVYILFPSQDFPSQETNISTWGFQASKYPLKLLLKAL